MTPLSAARGRLVPEGRSGRPYFTAPAVSPET